MFNELTSRINGYNKKNINVIVEQVSAMPGQGVTSMFNFGQSFGVIKGSVLLCSCLYFLFGQQNGRSILN